MNTNKQSAHQAKAQYRGFRSGQDGMAEFQKAIVLLATVKGKSNLFVVCFEADDWRGVEEQDQA